jgi:2-dehydro-3-deoxyphosphogluconate aldolase/(4S)-4-hydroxy-2-oxoglutarate aldolase
VRAGSALQAIEAAKALSEGGIHAVEIALTTPGAAGAISQLRAELPNLLLGVGSVTRLDEVRVAIDAGAAFVVTPGVLDDVLDAAQEANVLAVPGVLTPTEILAARDRSPLLKLFPASLGGPSLLRALRGPFPDQCFMPTGGVRAENLHEWFAAGACVVGAGADLCPPDALDSADFARITRRALDYTNVVQVTQHGH